MTGSSKYLSFIKDVYKGYASCKNFARHAGVCRVLDVQEGRVKVEFDVTEDLTNPFGTLHGGCTCTLVDMVTTTALLASPNPRPGVTVDIAVSCLAPAKIGDTVIIDAEVIKAGKSIGFTKASLILKSTNAVIATGLHTKAFPPQK